MSDYYESEIEPNFGLDFSSKKKKNLKKVKMKCNKCGCIDYTFRCLKCNYPMFKYHNHF